MTTICKSNFWTICGRIYPSRKELVKALRMLPPLARYKMLSMADDVQPTICGTHGNWFKCYMLHVIDGKTAEKFAIRFNTAGEVKTLEIKPKTETHE